MRGTPLAPISLHEQAAEREQRARAVDRARAGAVEAQMIRTALELSRRAQTMPASPIRSLAPLAEAAKARGVRVYHLNIGQPDIETPACMRARLKELDAKVLEYSPSSGTPEFVLSLQHY